MIYDIFDSKENGAKADAVALQEAPKNEEEVSTLRDRVFSVIAARLFFFLLFVADIVWAFYAISLLVISSVLCLLSFNNVPFFRKIIAASWLSVRRSIVCGLSLFITLFSPAFGIMIACTYFLMYDKAGVEEVVPASLQEQFKEFFQG